MNKAYTRIDWENYPSINTPINESNLNKMDASIDEVDNRVISLNTSKATKTEVETLVADVSFNESTGVITVTKKNGSTITIDTKMEKIAVNFTYDSATQQIILTLIDGTKQYIDLSALITQYEFLNSDTITFVVQADGKIKAEVLDGSITESKLQPNYLAQIKVETAKSQIYMNNASQSATQAKSYTVGGTGTRENEDTDNAMYYYEQAKKTDIGQISLKVNEINSNLDGLAFGEVAGGKNIAKFFNGVYDTNSKQFIYIGTSDYCSTNFIPCENKNSISVKTDNYSSQILIGIFDANKNFIRWKKKENPGNLPFTANITDAHYTMCIIRSVGGEVVQPSYFGNIMLNFGAPLPYEPYIPSVNMIADDVGSIKNDLVNKELPVGSVVMIFAESATPVFAYGTWNKMNTEPYSFDTSSGGASSRIAVYFYRRIS